MTTTTRSRAASTVITAVLAAITALIITGLAPADADPPDPPVRGTFVLVDQWRALDTRTGGHIIPGGNAPAIETGITDAQAVAVSITITDTAGPGYATAWATGLRPNTSVLTYDHAGATATTFAVVPVNHLGEFRVFTSNDAHIIVDILGYIHAGPDPFAWPPTPIHG